MLHSAMGHEAGDVRSASPLYRVLTRLDATSRDSSERLSGLCSKVDVWQDSLR